MEDGKEKIEEAVVETPKGRTAIFEAYKAANPDMEADPDDNALMDFAHSRHEQLSGANSKLSELVSNDPRLGATLSMLVGEGKSLPYAMGSVFGRDWLDGDMEEFEAGYQENLKRLAESKSEQDQAAKNIQDYQTSLAKYAEENGLDETQVAQLNDAIYADAENFLMGIIPIEYIKHKWEGMNHDKDVEEAASTGYVEGKNAAIDLKKKKAAVNPLPDLANTSGAGKPRATPKPQPRRGSFFDGFKE